MLQKYHTHFLKSFLLHSVLLPLLLHSILLPLHISSFLFFIEGPTGLEGEVSELELEPVKDELCRA